MTNYYYITYVTRKLGKQFFDSDVIVEHPFQWLRNAKSENNSKVVLLGWKEISEQEFQMYGESSVAGDLVEEASSSSINLLGQGSREGLEG
jgi:hypothetical protein